MTTSIDGVDTAEVRRHLAAVEATIKTLKRALRERAVDLFALGGDS